MEYRTIPEMLLSVCRFYGDTKTAFKFKKNGEYNNVSYPELLIQVEQLALGLLDIGIRSSDRIGIVSENRMEWIYSDFAITLIGAVDVPVFPNLTAIQEEYIFNDCQITAIIVSNQYQLNKVLNFKERLGSLRQIIVMNDEFESSDPAVKSLKSIIDRGIELRKLRQYENVCMDCIRKIKPDDLLTIIYTSGTMGEPKGVMLTHRNVVSDVKASVQAIGISDKDTFLSYLPLCHAYERTTGFYAAFSSGAIVALAESMDTVPVNINEIKPTFMTTVPRLLEIIKKKIIINMEKESASKQKIFKWAVDIGLRHIKNRNNPSIVISLLYKLADMLVFAKIREKTGLGKCLFVSGGAALSPEVAEFLIAAGIRVIEGYGLTEASPVVAVNRVNDMEIGTIGKPLPGVEVKIAEDGEILVRGQNVMKGYWNDKQATMEAIDEEGWLYTGDIGFFNDNGNIKITDRKKNILVSSGGKNIAPQPIENLLTQSIFIEQCILVGDLREYCTALITPDFTQLKILAANLGIQYNNVTELISNPQIITVIKKDIDRLQADHAKYERVRKFSLLSEPFTIENGELTPKLSIRRHVVERKYSDLIDQMY